MDCSVQSSPIDSEAIGISLPTETDLDRSGIYQIRNILNGKRYIGSAVKFRRRWAGHKSLLRKGAHNSRHLQNSWNKNGPDVFVFEVLEFCEPDALIQREQWWLDNRKPEYNISPTAGSPLGVKHSDEFRRKVSERFRGKRKSSEHIENMRRGISESWRDPTRRARNIEGLIRSYDERLRAIRSEQSKARWSDPEYRERLREKIRSTFDENRRALASEQSKSRWANPEYRERIISKARGRVVTQEQRQKISETLKGRPLSIETRKKKSILTDDQVRQIRSLRKQGLSYQSLADAFGVSGRTVERIVKGLRYQWVV